MKNYRFILVYVILLAVQVLLVSYFSLARYVLISVLPALILMLPLKTGKVWTMLIGFGLGFVVDFFSNGMLGITSLALVPVAFARDTVVGMVFSDELSSRGDEISVSRFGVPKVALASLLLCSLYFTVFIWADSAGTVPFWNCALRFVLSVLVSTPLSVVVSNLLRPR